MTFLRNTIQVINVTRGSIPIGLEILGPIYFLVSNTDLDFFSFFRKDDRIFGGRLVFSGICLQTI